MLERGVILLKATPSSVLSAHNISAKFITYFLSSIYSGRTKVNIEVNMTWVDAIYIATAHTMRQSWKDSKKKMFYFASKIAN